MPTQYASAKLQSVLQQQFGLTTFRPGQLDAIQALLQHRRVLCIQPTGHGKSLLYQLPTVLHDGISIVISPLLALMRDQIYQLNTRFHIPATSLNSDQTDIENAEALQQAQQGRIKILFIAPEQLDNLARVNTLLHLPIRLIVIDEAHCISTWGHDFRPSYRQILHFVEKATQQHSHIHLLALTATANQQVEQDIKQQLSSQENSVQVLRHSMDRPNIQLSVLPQQSLAAKLVSLQHLLSTLQGCGLIYCATRENTELVADYLQRQHIHAVAYHAGLDPQVKRNLQQAFINDEYKVIAATNALGMGIDKSNIRYIIHFDIPGSITAYYQEVGRAGRDGKPAQGILLFDPQDKKIQQYFIDASQPSKADFTNVYQTVANASTPLGLMQIKQLTGLHPTRINVVIAELLEQNFLEKKLYQRKQIYQCLQPQHSLNLERYRNQYAVKTRELNTIFTYATQQKQCLMQILRNALGDDTQQTCGHCINCNSQHKIIQNNHATQDTLAQTEHWLAHKTVPLHYRGNHLQPGIAVLNGQLRSPWFIQFMRERQQATVNHYGIHPQLLASLQQQLTLLHTQYAFKSLISIPSRTWHARIDVANLFANSLSIPLFDEVLHWHPLPEKRQGELLNNDQRRVNVNKKMQCRTTRSIPNGPILLLDDYTGSGATIKEAARAIKQAGYQYPIVPFTVASVKWRLGKAGMV
jgi:ATP-dependent DNA helicase RecQ